MLRLTRELKDADAVNRRGFTVTVGYVCEAALFDGGDSDSDSVETAETVRRLAEPYGFPFECIRLEEVFSEEVTASGRFNQVLNRAPDHSPLKSYDGMSLLPSLPSSLLPLLVSPRERERSLF